MPQEVTLEGANQALAEASRCFTGPVPPHATIRVIDPEEGVEFSYAAFLVGANGEEWDIIGAGHTVEEALEEALETIEGWRV